MPSTKNQRSVRVAQLLQQELASLIDTELKDPRVGFVTITGVRVTSDLSYANVAVSVYGTAQRCAEALAGLRAASAFLRRELARRIQLRHAPELCFEKDDTLERAARLDQLLRAPPGEEPPKPTDATLGIVETSRTDLMHTAAKFEASVQPAPSEQERRKNNRRSRIRPLKR